MTKHGINIDNNNNTTTKTTTTTETTMTTTTSSRLLMTRIWPTVNVGFWDQKQQQHQKMNNNKKTVQTKLKQLSLSSIESQPKKAVVVVFGLVIAVVFIVGHRNLTKVWSKSVLLFCLLLFLLSLLFLFLLLLVP